MNELDLLEPLKLFNSQLKDKHHQTVVDYFKELTDASKVDITKNKEICTKYYDKKAKVDVLNKKLGSSKAKRGFFIFLLIFSIVVVVVSLLVGISGVSSKDVTMSIVAFSLCAIHIAFIPLSIYWLRLVKKSIESLSKTLVSEQEMMNKYLSEAYASLLPLNNLYLDNIQAILYSKTIPLIQMDQYFNISRYESMIKNYGFNDTYDETMSTVYVQSGSILGNPFLFAKTFNMEMVNHVYTGTLVISWVTYSRDSKGRSYPVTHTQTLTATVTKPKPSYYYDQLLIYGNEAAPNLSFSRTPSSISNLGKEKIEKYVRSHEKDLTSMAEKALGKGKTFTPLGNSEFELVFGGLNRDHEIEYRLLFTPLAQKAMLELLKTPLPYGDDFSFKKSKCINYISSKHAQNFNMFVNPGYFRHFDYEKAKDNFLKYNDEYFQSVFFDFAPLLSIPLYQQHKAREYIYQGTIKSNISPMEHECLANRFDKSLLEHEKTKTDVILKTSFVGKNNDIDTVEVSAHSFDAIPQTTFIPVLGGDGRTHPVPVHWIEYEPLMKKTIIGASIIGGDNIKYRNVSNDSSSGDVVYERGLLSYIIENNHLNIDVKSLKNKMSKD